MKPRPTLDLAVIGNSNIAALIERTGRIVWTCWPRIDGDPVFCALVDGDAPDTGFFSIEFDEEATTAQAYVRNTAIVRTVVTAASGASFAITDFAPRFRQYGRTYRPSMLIRRIEPLKGVCRIRVRMRPRMGYGRHTATPIPGSNHIRYVTEAGAIRLTTDAPVSYIVGESAFVLSQPLNFIVHADESFSESIPRIAREFHDQTCVYWQHWVRNLNLPFEWQEAVIRAAITLQLCSFHETGAIVAALTTSIPEAPDSQRNWDYRYCWIRDAFFTVHGLNRVGATRTMERFIEYVTNVVALERRPTLKPVYSIVPETTLEERVAATLRGYRGHAPVRIGNAAVEQTQHDVYGSVILAASQMFFDERLPQKGDMALFNLLEPLGTHALRQRSRRMPGSGSIAAARAFTPTRRPCAGSPATGSVASPHSSACRIARSSGAHRPTGLRATILERAWNKEHAGLRRQPRQRRDRCQRAAAARARHRGALRRTVRCDCRHHRPAAAAQWPPAKVHSAR